MAIKNYTTEIDVYKSLGEIQGALAGHGARKVMVDYDAAGQLAEAVNGAKFLVGGKAVDRLAGILGITDTHTPLSVFLVGISLHAHYSPEPRASRPLWYS